MSPKDAVADSWEDEDSDTEPKQVATSAKKPSWNSAAPVASTLDVAASAWGDDSENTKSSTSLDEDPNRRPEKTDAVARRMIAAGLGLKAPKQTDEQRAYQKSIREQERKKREQERSQAQKRKEDDVKAKAAMWDD